MTSPLSLTGFPLELLVLVPLVIAASVASRALEARFRVGLAALTPILVVVVEAVRPEGAGLYLPLLTIARAGSLDLGIALVFDEAAAIAAFALGLAVLALSLADRPGRTLAKLHALAAAAMLAILADNLPLALVGWLAVAALATGASRVVAWARLGDVAWLAALALAFWLLAGTWGPRGYAPDLRPRFAPSNAGTQADPMARRPGEDQRLAQRADPPLPELPGPQEVPRKLPPARPDAPRGLPSVEANGQLTMTTHPGARIFLGVATVDELRANQDRPRCEGELRPDCVAIAPFVRMPIRAGIHRVAIVPGGGAIVGGDGVEAAGFTLRVAPGEDVHLEAIGPTLRFAELGREIQRRRDAPQRPLWGLSPLTLLAVFIVIGLAAMAGMAPFFWLAEATSRGDATAPLTAAIAPLIAAHLAARLAVLIAPAAMFLALLAAASALAAALIAAHQRDARRSFGWIAAALGAALLGGAEASWALVLGAAVHAVCLAAWWASLEAACDAVPADLEAIGKVDRPAAKAGLVAAIGLAGLPPLGGYLAREGALSATKDAGGMIALIVAVAAAAALAFAVARVHLSVLAAKPRKKERSRSRFVGARTLALAVVALLAATIAGLSDRPIGGGGLPLVAAWVGGAAGARGGGRIVVAALLAVGATGGWLAARRGGGGAVRWLAAELGFPWLIERLASLGGAVVGLVRRADGAAVAPIDAVGRRLDVALSRLGASGGGRVALVVVTLGLIALAAGVVAR